MKKTGTLLLYLLIPILFYITFKDFPIQEMKEWIGSISIRTVFILIIFNIIAFCLMGLRWFYLLKLEKTHISFFKITLSRLIGFSWSYITPGSQVGGEIFQANYAASEQLAIGTSAVTLLQDRLMELIGNILVVIFILSFYYTGVFGSVSSIFISVILSLIFIFKTDFSTINLELIVLKLSLFFFKKTNRSYSLYRKIKKYKTPVIKWPDSYFVRLILLLSIWITPVIALIELFIFFNLTGFPINMLEALILLGAIKISFYTPVPGAMGFFEAGVLLACQLLNIPVVLGLGFVVYSRIRDLTQVTAGLLLFVKNKIRKLM